MLSEGRLPVYVCFFTCLPLVSLFFFAAGRLSEGHFPVHSQNRCLLRQEAVRFCQKILALAEK